jgi:hypothetical protein
MVEAEVSGLDIMHGELKNLMLLGEKELERTLIVEQESGDAMDSMVRTECEGRLDTLVALYELTYQLSFAIGDRNA